MKSLIGLSAFLFSTISFACTNFSGTYMDLEREIYSVTQNGCESLTVTSEEGTFTALADGVLRVSTDSEEATIMTAVSFSGKDLIMDNYLQFKVSLPPEIPAEVIPVRMYSIYSKLVNGDVSITTTAYNMNGQVLGIETGIHQKQ